MARELGINANLLHRWKKIIKMESMDVELENIELRKQLREIKEEKDILKKAALIFGEKD